MFKKRKLKEINRIDELIEIAARDEEWDLVAELELEKRQIQSKGWNNGFAIGYGSAAAGVLLSKLVGDIIRKSR